MFDKYTKYLQFKHNWQGINCLTLIEVIYKDHLGINWQNNYKHFGIDNANDNIDRKWVLKFGKDLFEEESKQWQKIPLSEMKEYDILVFLNEKRNRVIHFGMCIGGLKFIHCEQNQYVRIQEIRQEDLDNLMGIYRYVV